MYCTRCGAFVGQGSGFCARCGTPAMGDAPGPAIGGADASERLFRARLLVAVAWIILIPLLIINLHAAAAGTGIILAGIFTLVWSVKIIPSRYKFLLVPVSLVIVAGIQWAETSAAARRYMRLEAENKQIAAQSAEAARLKVQQEQQAFDRMTPSEHLAAEERDLVSNAPEDAVADGMRQMNALQSTPIADRAKAVFAQYQAAQAAEERRFQAAEAAGERKAAAESRKEAEQGRILVARTLENSMLAQGYDMEISAIGPGHTTLRIKYVLADRPFAYQTANSREITGTARDAGFKRILLYDGFDESWSIPLQ